MNQTGWIIILSYAASGLVFALLCRSITRQKGYENSGKYAVLGFFFNIIAFIYAAGLPDLKARAAIAGLLPQASAVRPSGQAGAEDPGVIAAIAAAISMIWHDEQPATAGTAAAATLAVSSSSPAASPSPAGFIIRKVRRV